MLEPVEIHKPQCRKFDSCLIPDFVCWIPSHVGILGNEKADAAAKSALSLPVTRMKLPATGMYPRITKLIGLFDEWQEVWDCCTGNKLHAIRPAIGYYKQKTDLSRRDTVLLNRLRILVILV